MTVGSAAHDSDHLVEHCHEEIVPGAVSSPVLFLDNLDLKKFRTHHIAAILERVVRMDSNVADHWYLDFVVGVDVKQVPM